MCYYLPNSMQLFSDLKEKLIQYIDTRIKLYQISLEERAVELMSNLALLVVIIGVFIFSLTFFLLFIAKLINHFVGYEFVGYGIIVLICIFMSLLLVNKKGQQYIIGKIRKQITENLNKRNNGNKNNEGV